MEREHRSDRGAAGARGGAAGGGAGLARRGGPEPGGAASRGQAEELRRPPVSDKVVQAVRDKLSYGAFDYAVTDAEAAGALFDLARMPESQRRGVVQQLHKDGLLERLFDNLPLATVKARGREVTAVYAVCPPSFLSQRMESMLSTSVFDWMVSKEDAQAVMQIVAVLPQATRDEFTFRDNGKWFNRLMKAAGVTPEPKGDEAGPAGGAGGAGEGGAAGKSVKGPPAQKAAGGGEAAQGQGGPGLLARSKAGYRACCDLAKGGKLDLDEVEAVMGGGVGGVQLAKGAAGENQLQLALDWNAGTFDAQIAALNLASMQVGSGDSVVSTGPGRITGIHAQVKWSTEQDPTSQLRFELDDLTLRDVQILLSDIQVVIGMVALHGLEVFAARPPERQAPPTSKAEAVSSVGRQVKEVIGLTLPSLSTFRNADPKDPRGLVDRLKENFGGQLEMSVHLDSASIRDVVTSQGDKTESLELSALDVAVRQESRIVELQTELANYELTLKESGDLGALSSEDHQRMAVVKAELERLKPLDAERRRLAAGFQAGTLNARQRDRLRELDNELNQGVARIELSRMAATGVNAKGHQMARGEIEGMRARVSGGSLDYHQETDRERLARHLGTPAPSVRGAGGPSASRAELSVARASTQGVAGDKLAMQRGEVKDLKASVHDAQRLDRAKGDVSVGSVSATQLQTGKGAVGQVDLAGVKAGVDQSSKTAQASVRSGSATGVQAGGASLDSASIRDLGAQAHHYDDGARRTAKASLGEGRVQGVSHAQGKLADGAIHDVRASAGPGLKSAQADVGGLKASGLTSDRGSLDAASLQGLHIEGADLADPGRRAGSATLASGEIEGLNAGGVRIDAATATGVHAGVSDVGDPARRRLDYGVDGVEGQGVHWGLGRDSAAAGRLKLGATTGAVGKDQAGDVAVDVRSTGVELDDVRYAREGERAVSAGRLGLSNVDVATRGAAVDIGAGKLSAERMAYKDEDTDASLAGLDVDGARVKAQGNQFDVGVGGVGVRGGLMKHGDASVGVDEARVTGVSVAGNEKDLRVGADGLAVKGARAGKGDRSASVDSLGVDGVRADVDKQGRRVRTAGISAVDVKNARVQDGDRRASVASAGVRDVTAEGLGLGAGGAPEGKVGVGEARIGGAYAKDGDRTASLGSATVKALSADARGGGVQVGVGSAAIRDLRAQDGDAASLNVAAADLGRTRGAVGGLGSKGGPRLRGARTEGLQAQGIQAQGTPSRIRRAKAKAATGGRTGATTGATTTETPTRSTGAGPGRDAGPAARQGGEFRADALRGMTGHVRAVLPVMDPIKTTVTVDIPVRNGQVNLDELRVDVTGLLANIAIGDHPVQVTKEGGLRIDITGPWDVTILEPGRAAGLITEEQGGGKRGTIALEPLVEGLMNAKVTKTGDPAEKVGEPKGARGAPGAGKGKEGKTKERDEGKDKPPIALGRTEIHVSALRPGDGRVGTADQGLTVAGGADPGANAIDLDGVLGDDLRLRADRLRTRDVDAAGVHADRLNVDGLAVDVDKPLDEQRRVRVNVDSIATGAATFGDQDALAPDPHRNRS